jgi:hypothetical protein
MSETVWIVATVAGWIVVMTAISGFGRVAKQSDHARRSVISERRRIDVFGDVREKALR